MKRVSALLFVALATVAVAFVEKNGRCGGSYGTCVEGLACVGSENMKRCEEATVEAAETIGERELCVPDQGPRCGPGLECVGPTGEQRCSAPMNRGQMCTNRYMVCGEGLVCSGRTSGVCREANSAVEDSVLGARELCVPDQGPRCGTGLECVGPTGEQRCSTPMRRGQQCTDRYLVCGEGLVCSGRKRGVCRRSRREGGQDVLLERELCVPNAGPVCGSVLQCVGPTGEQRCSAPVRRGQRCTSRYLVCGEGLVCSGGRNGVCRLSRREGGQDVLRQRELCSPRRGPRCARGLQCVGPTGEQRCSRPMRRGQRCAGKYMVCDKGLTCTGRKSKVCRKPREIGQSCSYLLVCKRGLSCKRTERQGRGEQGKYLPKYTVTKTCQRKTTNKKSV